MTATPDVRRFTVLQGKDRDVRQDEATGADPGAAAVDGSARRQASPSPARGGESGGRPATVIDPSALRTGSAGLLPLLGYQPFAVSALSDGLGSGGRGQIISACGTGKTNVGVHTALRVSPAGTVVLACPTLSLLAQTLDRWAGVARHILAVCSDTTITRTAWKVHGIRCPTTTDVAEVVAWLRTQRSDGLRLILVTHRSAAVVGAALCGVGVPADLLLIDEAHRTAGHVDKKSALLHDDSRLPAVRRLYMTATPRVLGPRQDPRQAMSMHDERIFGPVLFHYSFAEAIADGWLDDFQVVAIGITRREVLHLLRNTGRDAVVQAGDAPLHTVVVQAALIRAAKKFGLRRILVFARTISESREFARTLAGTVQALAPQERPDGLLTIRHVDGTQDVATRSATLDLLADPPEGGWCVVSNPQCLNEGIDIPGIDGLAYIHPPGSVIEGVQGASRALRRNPHGPGIATILVSILLPDDGGDLTDQGPWDTLLQTLWALRAHDERLAASLDRQRARSTRGQSVQLPPQVRLLLPGGYATPEILDHVAVRIVEHASTTWTAGIEALTAFHAEHGHTRVPAGYRTGSLDLSQWLRRELAALRAGQQPPDRAAALQALGLNATITDRAAPPTVVEQTARQLAAVRAFHAEHGHLRALPGTVIDGINVHRWIAGNRQPGSVARTDRALRQILDVLDPGWEFDHEPECVASLHAARAYHLQYGDLRPAPDTVISDRDVHQWLHRCRQPDSCAHRDRSLHTLLTTMDPRCMRPALRGHDEALCAARSYHAKHGHLYPPAGTVIAGTDFDQLLKRLASWFDNNSLSAGQIAAWKALGVGPKHHLAVTFERGITAARQYRDREGHLNPPVDHQENGITLKWWLQRESRYALHRGYHTAEQLGRLRDLGIRTSLPALTPRHRPARSARTGRSPLPVREQQFRAVQAFHRQHGHLFPSSEDVIDGHNLSGALRQARTLHAKKRLTSEEIARWNALGIVWESHEAVFARGITACRFYRAREGHLKPGLDHIELGILLATWLEAQHQRAAAGHLTHAELDQLIDVAPERFTPPDDTDAPPDDRLPDRTPTEHGESPLRQPRPTIRRRADDQ